MCNAKYNEHKEPLSKDNNLLMIENIFKLNCLRFCHKFINKNVPKFFKDIFTRNPDAHACILCSHQKSDEGMVLIFVSGKNRPLLWRRVYTESYSFIIYVNKGITPVIRSRTIGLLL